MSYREGRASTVAWSTLSVAYDESSFAPGNIRQVFEDACHEPATDSAVDSPADNGKAFEGYRAAGSI